MLTQNPDATLILVVEDDESHAELIQRSFETAQEEYRLEIADTLQAARKAMERHSPALILTDYRLPDGDGKELVVLAGEACPVILMTSYGNEQVAVEVMKIGAQDYVVKSPEMFATIPRISALTLREWKLVLQHRKADEAIRRANQEWELTFDTVPDLISIIDSNHTLIRVNRAMADRCGLQPNDLVGRKCFEVMHGLDKPPVFCPHVKMIQDGQEQNGEIENTRLNCVFDVSLSPLYDLEGQIVACVHVARDITGRKKMEEALRESEGRYRAIIDAFDGHLYISSQDYNISFMNNKLIERTGRNAIGEPCFKALHDLDAVCPWCANDLVFKGEVVSWEMLSPKDGRWYNVVNTPIYNADGTIAKQAMIYDITDRKMAEEERRELEQKFQQTQKIESLGVLAGGIAHDFNNILTIILGNCFMIMEEADPGLTQNTNILQIEDAANRAAELCRQMLAYAGKSSLVQTQIDMRLLLDEMVKMLKSAIKKNVTIELDLMRNLPEITGDNSQIQQIVMNLIINAAEAIGDNNGTIRVVLTKATVQAGQTDTDVLGNNILAGSYACLVVSDNGCGMDEETQKRIFEPFFTTKFTGRGLGMSATLGIIKSHEGALQLSSSPGVGTSFTCYFPLPALPGVTETRPAVGVTPSIKGHGNILLVDDEQALLSICSSLLKSMGFSAMTAANGREALAAYHECGGGIDLVLMDLVMPEMGGVEAYRELRRVAPTLPIVISSGYSVEDITEFMDDEYAEVIQKPYRPSQVQEVLMKLLCAAG